MTEPTEAWRLLCAEYAGSSGARLGNMVREVVCPRDQWLADVSAGKDFLTSLIEWEIKVAAYEVASGDRISEAVRAATIMDHAPDAVKSMLRLSPLEQRRSVDALKLTRGKLCHAWTLPRVDADTGRSCL